MGELGEVGGVDGRVGEEAHLPCLRQRISIAEITERHEGFVPLETGEQGWGLGERARTDFELEVEDGGHGLGVRRRWKRKQR